MSATEKLRALLDERGIMHKTDTFVIDADHGKVKETAWVIGNSHYVYQEYRNRTVLTSTPITPEQAVAATLWRGTCEIETTESWLPAERYHRCKHCGAFFAVLDASGDIPPCVCPNCGKAVKR